MSSRLVPCRLAQVVIDEHAEHQSIIIAELDGPRRFPIAIGAHEALAIDSALKGVRFPRPSTHDLIAVLLLALRGRLDEVRIVDLDDGVFRADLRIDCHGAIKEIDCRPSDAIAMLVRQPQAALLVADHVLAEACPE